MARRLLPGLLVFAAFLCDVGGGHGAALVLLFLAIPAACMLALDCYGDKLEGRCGPLRPMLAGLAVFLLVLSAALRSPAVVGGVPQLAVSALVLVLALYCAVAVGALKPARRPAVVRVYTEELPAQRRRAA
jgi:hypothetical protein